LMKISILLLIIQKRICNKGGYKQRN
jgi:hypothetical protein